MYQIVKGWPSEGAIDEIFVPATAGAPAEGFVGRVKTDGKAETATYLSNGTDAGLQSFFVIDVDTVKDNVTGLMSKCLIEVDADHYAAASYAAGDALTAAAGKFAKVTEVAATYDEGAIDVAATATKTVGRVVNVDATTGKMRILFYGN